VKRSTALSFGHLLLMIAPVALGSGPIRLHFDSDAPGTEPAFLRFESSEGLSSDRWRAVPSDNPMTTPNVAVQTDPQGSPGKFRFALSKEAGRFRDGSVQASVQCQSAGNPCRPGVVLRYRDPRNFVAALCELSKSSVSAAQMRNGKLEILASAGYETRERFWTTVAVEAAGDRLEIRVGGRIVLTAKDPHPQAGEAGVVSEAGSIQRFDELILTPK
jgi:hypothetical protein